MSDTSTPEPGDDERPGQPPQYGQPQYGQPQHGPPPQYGQPPPYAQPGFDQGYQPGYYGWYQPMPNHPQANTALTLGLVSLVGGMLCGLPMVLGPFAWVIGRKAILDIDASGGQLGGRGNATVGMVCGIIATVLLLLGVLTVAALVVVAIASAGFEVTTQA